MEADEETELLFARGREPRCGESSRIESPARLVELRSSANVWLIPEIDVQLDDELEDKELEDKELEEE